MPKFMNNMYGFSRIFWESDKGGGAGGAAGSDDNAGDGDDQDDDESDEDGEDEPKYTQADLDKAVARTIAKERRKAERAKEKEANGGDDSKGKNGGSDGESEDAKALKAEREKVSGLEVKVACFEAGVAKDAVEDVTALAKAYMSVDEDLDLEDAIEKVVKKYPQFKESAGYDEEDEKKSSSWGQRHGKPPKKETSVDDEIRKQMFGK